MIPNEKLIEILCCPGCRGALATKESPGSLVCTACGESFASSNGIFEMLRRQDLLDRKFLKYRESYEEHAKEDLFSAPSDVTQWSWLEMLAGFMGDREDRLILDAGSADGKLGAIISGRVVCFDISMAYLKAAKEKGLTAVAGRAEALPFKRVFDAVVLSNVLEHVPDPEAIAAQVRHVLKPGGSLYVIIPYKEDLSWYEYENVLDPHLTSFDLPRIKDLLSNFRIVRHKFILFTTSRPLYFLKSRIKDIFPDLYKSLRAAKNTLGKHERKGNFPRWRNALNYFPNALVLPFMRPYLILLEAKLTE